MTEESALTSCEKNPIEPHEHAKLDFSQFGAKAAEIIPSENLQAAPIITTLLTSQEETLFEDIERFKLLFKDHRDLINIRVYEIEKSITSLKFAMAGVAIMALIVILYVMHSGSQ